MTGTDLQKLNAQEFERPEIYRRSVGIMLINKDKLVFIGKRLGAEGLWQMPQGGIEPGETLVKAGLRELYEETNIQQVRIIAETKEWLYYDFPLSLVNQLWHGMYRGQQQKWILATFEGSDSSIEVNKPGAEFSAWRWSKVSDLPKVAVPYKRDSYIQVLAYFAPLIDSLVLGPTQSIAKSLAESQAMKSKDCRADQGRLARTRTLEYVTETEFRRLTN